MRPASPTDDTHVTRVLAGRYRLMRLVGHGGMGSVYEAVHIHTEKRVAVKLLSPQLSKDLKLVARFRREAMAASRLEHENCVQVDDFGEDADGTFYIAMELVEGHGLADELRKSGPMEPARVAHIAVQLLKALDAAHSAGVLHRDLKPQNVMLTDKPQKPDLVKVVDFGIAKITTNTPEDQGVLTVPGTIFGTPEYMSPEQARGETLDVRSDLYSAAVVLWHMMLGRSPFRGTSVRETLMKVFADEPPLPSQERPNVNMPAGFEQVLLVAMSKKKADRYPDAASFLEALRPFVRGAQQAEVPRRPLSGMPSDGSPPPATLDDARSVTQAIPEALLPPLASPSAPPARPLGTPAAPPPAPPVVVPEASQGGARVLGLATVKRQTQSATLDTLEGDAAASPRRTRRLSPAAIVVFSISAVGALLLAAAVVSVLYLVNQGFFEAKQSAVADVVEQKPVTNIEHQVAKDKVDAELRLVPVDPVARDAAMARADQAIALGDIAGARRAYEDATASDPAFPRALVGLATTAMQQKDWVAACSAFETVMALDANYARKLGPMYARAKKFRDGTN